MKKINILLCSSFLCFFVFPTHFLFAKKKVPLVSPTALLFRGQYALDKGKYRDALIHLTRASKTLGHWGIVQLELARARFYNGQSSEDVLKLLTQAKKSIPKNPRLHDFLGLFYEGLGQEEQAIKHYKQALKLGSVSIQTCLRASRVWLRTNQPQPAIQCLQAKFSQTKQKPLFHELLASAYTRSKHYTKAAYHWKQALELQPKNLLLWKDSLAFFRPFIKLCKNRRQRWQWKKFLRRVEKKLRKALPKKRRRKLRPLRPSKSQRRK